LTALDVLVVNAGSTSLKLSLVSPAGETTEIACNSLLLAPTQGERPKCSSSDSLLRELSGAVAAVGHRVVHGGARFAEPALIDDGVLAAIRELTPIAPLHNAPALAAIDSARAAIPGVPHVAVFDTAFHRTIPPAAGTYAVPARWRDEWGIRRYGFHGLSVQWSAEQVPVPRLIVCHLGGGCSVTAVRDGRSVDTTMGFSPLEGVPMATRAGSVDPGALLYLLRERGLTLAELDRALELESGLAALGGLDDSLGFAVYTYRVAAAAAQMTAALGGLDALVFTAGVGENRPDVREAVVERLRFLGEFRVEVVPAREDVVIARETRALLEGKPPD
jgi:acetate kinase